jgi:hypothetical protein
LEFALLTWLKTQYYSTDQGSKDSVAIAAIVSVVVAAKCVSDVLFEENCLITTTNISLKIQVSNVRLMKYIM